MVSTRSSTLTKTPEPKRQSPRVAARASRSWRHEPSTLTLAWMAISLPLVVWDTIYVLGRPYTMEGGALYWPMYVPYKLYGTVDYVYGWKAFDAQYGFTGAQGFLNLVETLMYGAYLALHYRGKESGSNNSLAVLVGFSAAVMTLSKTVLYWLNEYYGSFANIGHNPLFDLIFLWIIPNGAWLVGSSYMIWDLGSDILQGLNSASAPKRA